MGNNDKIDSHILILPQEMKYDVLISNGEMIKKPVNDVFQSEIHKNGSMDNLREQLTIDEIHERLIAGCSFVGGKWKKGSQKRREENLEYKQFLNLDFDGCMSIEEFLKRAEEMELLPNIIHTSSSHLKDGKTEKFRAIYVLDRPAYKDEFKYNTDLLVKNFGGYEKWRFARKSDGSIKKEIVKEGIDPSSKKYNQIMYGYCNSDKTNLFSKVYHYEALKVQKVPQSVKDKREKIERESAEIAKAIRGWDLEFFEEYPLHNQFVMGDADTFGGPGTGTFPNLLEVAYNYYSLGEEERFKERLERYEGRSASQFESIKSKVDLYPSEDFTLWLLENPKTPKNLRDELAYKKAHFSIYEHDYGYRYIKKEHKGEKITYKSLLITDFTLELTELIQGSTSEEISYRVWKDGRVIKEASADVSMLNTKQKFNQSIGFANFMGGTDFYLGCLKAYLIEKYKKRVVTGVDKVSYKHGIYVGNKAAIDSDGKSVKNYTLLKSHEGIRGSIELQTPITEAEKEVVREALFNFNNPMKSAMIMGWIGATFLKPHTTIQFPYLFITGGHGSGKTSTADLLSSFYSIDGTSNRVNADGITKFTISKMAASSEFIPLHMDEFKLNMMTPTQAGLASSFMRTAYDRGQLPRGRADQGYNEYYLTAPVLVTGETQTEEEAIRDRSILLDFNGNEKDKRFKILLKNKHLLKKLGHTALREALSKESDVVKRRHKEFEEFLLGQGLADRESRNMAWVFLGLRFWESIMGKCVEYKEVLEWHKSLALEMKKPPLEKFLDAVEELYHGGYIRWDEHFKIVSNDLRLNWPKFYPALKLGVNDGVTQYEILTPKDLKKYLGHLKGVDTSKATLIDSRKPRCVSIPLEKEWGIGIVCDRVRE